MALHKKYQAYFNELKEGSSEADETKHSKVLIVDGLNTFIRSYASSPVTNLNGEHVGGISGFLLSVGHAIKMLRPTRVVIVFDGKDGSGKRRAIYPEYKAHRKVKIRLNRSETVDQEDNQLQQLTRLIDYLEVLPFTTLIADGAEADDVIAYFTQQCRSSSPESIAYVMSSDKDFMQLVDKHTHIWSPTKKKLYYEKDVVEEFGIHPCNFALFRALTGDASDNIPGVKGLGTKSLLSKFPKISEDQPITPQQFGVYVEQLVKANPKAKVFQKVADAQQDIELFHSITQLSESLISGSGKLKIVESLNLTHTPFSRLKFHSMLREDGMDSAIRNLEIWIREVTIKLDKFCLQD